MVRSTIIAIVAAAGLVLTGCQSGPLTGRFETVGDKMRAVITNVSDATVQVTEIHESLTLTETYKTDGVIVGKGPYTGISVACPQCMIIGDTSIAAGKNYRFMISEYRPPTTNETVEIYMHVKYTGGTLIWSTTVKPVKE